MHRRPFGPPIATPATSIGLIYLIILSFFSFTFFLPIHLKYLSPRGHPPLHFTHLIAWRYLATVMSYFLLSCIYSLVSLMFLFPFDGEPGSHVHRESKVIAYGRATWMVYWMVNWLGMTALGLASENMAMLLGTPWTAIWLIFWVITNVSTGFYPIVLENSFFRWGYAWPIHNVAEATRQILFDLHPRIGLNLGILVVWVSLLPRYMHMLLVVEHVTNSYTGRHRHRALPALLLLHAVEYDQGQKGRRCKRRSLATADEEREGGSQSSREDHDGAA